MDFREHTVEGLAAQVRSREVSARELTQAALDRIAAVDGTIHAFIAVDAELALADADLVDARLAGGDDVGPLAGIPIGVKDLEDAHGFVTTHGSVLSRDDAPAMADSLFVARLKAAGCVVVGKTNTPEMGCKGDTTNGLGPPTVNPWDTGRSAGGSSGGSAAAVAAGMVPLATGSDGGGSIRIPAAICGLTGFKPSLGRVPIGGPTPPAWADLSSKGPITRRARDAAAVLDAVVGPDPTDLRSLPRPRAAWRPQLDEPHPPLRVAWSPTLGYAPVDSGVAAVCAAAIERAGRHRLRGDRGAVGLPRGPGRGLAGAHLGLPPAHLRRPAGHRRSGSCSTGPSASAIELAADAHRRPSTSWPPRTPATSSTRP